jgi:CubicO group peptidase (beta-lactamase class C family)
VLLGAVLQRAGGERFEDLVAKRVARPLGMTTLRPDKQWLDIPHRTIGYQKDKSGAVVPSDDSDVSWKLAGGGFICCVEDLARFGSGMLACRIVDQATRERMWTPQSTKDGTVTDYGLGFRIDTYGGSRLILHGGSQEKTRTRLLILPDADLVVVLMCNSEWADLQPLGKLLLDALVDAK